MKFSLLIITLALALAFAPHTAAQTKAEREKDAEKRAEEQHEGEDSTIERRASVERSVLVSLCVGSGDVVVRGWDRTEVLARASDAGSLRLLTPNVQPAPRVEVLVAEEKDAEFSSDKCGSASSLELTVPRGATVSIEARSGHVEVSEVADVRVHALSGDIDVRRVSKAVEVSCLSGDISLSDSSGPARVSTVSGNVEVRNVRASAAGDGFDAKSVSGDVTLEGVTHAQVRGTTTNGSILYKGALARGGDYNFTTISGDVTLELPANSSFGLHAKVIMSGDIITDFPVKISPGSSPSSPGVPPNPPVGPAGMPPPPPDWKKAGKNKPPKGPQGTRLDGTVGTGDAIVNLSSFSGSLYLRKQ